MQEIAFPGFSIPKFSLQGKRAYGPSSVTATYFRIYLPPTSELVETPG